MSDNFKNKPTASPEAKKSLNQMKAEIAKELSIVSSDAKNTGSLTSMQNGYDNNYMDLETAKKRFNIKDKGTNIT